ncbi:MAG: hypothetical protein H7Z11_01515 [Verrucomicrobia bacterium]|nr:hypothetical protein [Leptolyngbya sp. ES-bin-22]
MNNLYFACTNCKVFVDAGYRWAYWELVHPCTVKPKEYISVEAVLRAAKYWNPEQRDESTWLYKDVLPSVRAFFETHWSHKIIFGESEDFLTWDNASFLEWKQLGHLLEPLPRYFVEELKFKSWGEVCEYIKKQEQKPWWWELEWQDTHQKARRKFEELTHEITFS